MQKNKIILFLILLFSTPLLAQEEQSITAYLKLIESGQKDEVLAQLPKLKQDFPKDPSIKFLEAVLTENGETAALMYDDIIQNYPKSKYADAALFRLYSFYYASGHYNIAKKYAGILKSDFPSSPYIKLVNSQIPSQDNVLVDVTPEVTDTKPVKNKTEIKTPEKKNTEIKKTEKPLTNENYKFVIQAGAFTKKENALGLKQNLEASKFFVELKEKTIGGTVFHILYVGKYNDKTEAEKVLVSLKNEFEIAGRIIPKEKK